MHGYGEVWLERVLAGVREQFRLVADVRRRRAGLAPVGSAGQGRVTVVVDSDGVVSDTRFALNVDDLSYDELARAYTAAAQRASAELSRQVRELIEPLRRQRERNGELIDGISELRGEFPVAPTVSLRSPDDVAASRDEWWDRDHR